MTTTFEKKVIVNGSINPSITLDEILEHYTANEFKDAAWNIAVKLDVYFGQKLATYDEVCAEPREMLIKLWGELEKATNAKAKEKASQEFQEGLELFAFLDKFKIKTDSVAFRHPEFPMTPNQALGFLSTYEQWNNYDSQKIASAVRKIEDLNIREDFGVNNPNTGSEITTYLKKGDCFIVSFKVSERQHDEWVKKHEASVTTILTGAAPDSVRVIKGKFDITFVAYWD